MKKENKKYVSTDFLKRKGFSEDIFQNYHEILAEFEDFINQPMTTPQEAITAENKTPRHFLEKYIGSMPFDTPYNKLQHGIILAMEEYAQQMADREISKKNEEIATLRNEYEVKLELALQKKQSEVRAREIEFAEWCIKNEWDWIKSGINKGSWFKLGHAPYYKKISTLELYQLFLSSNPIDLAGEIWKPRFKHDVDEKCVWQVGEGKYAKWFYAYRDHQDKNQHSSLFDTKEDAEAEYDLLPTKK